MKYSDASPREIDSAIEKSWEAFLVYRKCSLRQRAKLMRTIATEMEGQTQSLLRTAMEETHLAEARLGSEIVRTIFQLNSYADGCEKGDWMDIRIDTGIPDRKPPKPDLRKMQVPLGPVVVFGASNFPFAYSTAGGDTACALAAGCPVIVKAHPGHAGTSQAVAEIIHRAVEKNGLPEGVFTHVHGAAFETGKQLVMHPLVKAAGFTGSFGGGKALFDSASQRKEPIPFFAEMGSINPVFLLPGKLKAAPQEIASLYAASITLSVGQFCTNPGLLVALDGDDLRQFLELLSSQIRQVPPAPMLHPGIAKSYTEKKNLALAQKEVSTVAQAEKEGGAGEEGRAIIASATGQAFLTNPVLHQEVFGPYSLVIRCKNKEEMLQVAHELEGQLTTTLMATADDIKEFTALAEILEYKSGRYILNGVPTGVEVSLAMQHGGPFPATTDSRYSSVGADGIRRFARPLCYQNWTDALLPEELKDANPLGIWRTVNNELTKNPINR